jgi:type II secretory pathway pseudopilin PulG
MTYCAKCGSQVPDGAAFCPKCGTPAPASVVTTKKSSSKALYLVLGCVGLLVLVAVLGIVAAILIPNFLDAVQKAKQKRAIVDLQRIGQAVEAYKAEHDNAPAASDMAALAAALDAGSSPIPRLDPWKNPYRYVCWQESQSAKGCDHYRIASAGRDGKFEQLDLKSYQPAEFTPTEYDRDIVYGDGAFIVQPQRR